MPNGNRLIPGRGGVPIRDQVASGNNRLSTTQATATGVPSRTSQIVAFAVDANSNFFCNIPGTMFYLTAVTAPVQIRPNPTGAFDTYSQGTGKKLAEENAFSNLEIKNTTANPVVVQMFVGFEDYIDNRVYLPTQDYPQIAFPTYPVPNVSNQINITDLSGTKFTDINGKQWYALTRTSIIVSNVDTGATFLVQKASATLVADPAIAAVYPTTSLRLDLSGNYRIQTAGGGNINMIVSEIYTALPA